MKWLKAPEMALILAILATGLVIGAGAAVKDTSPRKETPSCALF